MKEIKLLVFLLVIIFFFSCNKTQEVKEIKNEFYGYIPEGTNPTFTWVKYVDGWQPRGTVLVILYNGDSVTAHFDMDFILHAINYEMIVFRNDYPGASGNKIFVHGKVVEKNFYINEAKLK